MLTINKISSFTFQPNMVEGTEHGFNAIQNPVWADDKYPKYGSS